MTKIPSRLAEAIRLKYQIEDNAFVREAKADPADRIEIEVGDTKQAGTFYPQVKIKRWDNGANLSLRLIDDNTSEGQVYTTGDTIRYVKANKEARFYELEASQDHPEGGFEFEVVFSDKPASNVVSFSIETKGLEFYYQPELTEKEIALGAIRPDNVVGSYAVYYQDCPANIAGGKLYRTGKAFHIYRPHAKDSRGKGTWAELSIDTEAKLMTVTVPQAFLDEAIYPVIVDPTFGYGTLGASNSFLAGRYSSVDYAYLWGTAYAKTGNAGSVDSVSVGLYGSAAATIDIRTAIYDEDSGGANTHGLVAQAQALGVSVTTTNGFKAVTFAGESLDATNTYMLLVKADPNDANEKGIYVCYDTAAGNTYYYQDLGGVYTTFPDPLNLTETGTNIRYSIYATYTDTPAATNVNVNAPVLSLTLSLPTPTASAQRQTSIAVDVQTLTLSLLTPTVTTTSVTNVTVEPDTLSLAISLPQPTITTRRQVAIAVDCQELSLSLLQPLVSTMCNVDVIPEALEVALSAPQTIVTAVQNRTVEVDTVNLTLHLVGFSVSTGSDVLYSPPTLSINLSVPDPSVSTVRNVIVEVDPLELTLSVGEVYVDLSADAIVKAELLHPPLSLPEPTVATQRNVTCYPPVMELGGYPRYILVDGQYARRVVGRYYVCI